MNKIIKRFEKLMISSVLIAVLDIIVGIVFIQFTDLSTKMNVLILGSLVLIHGIFYIIKYIYDGLGNRMFAIDLIAGVASVILGLFIIFNPFDALKVLGIFACIWLCINGLEKIYFGYKFMKVNEDIYPLTSFIGILMIVMGILLAFNPFKLFMLITRLVGLFLICSGLFDTMACMLFRKRAKYILDIFK